MVLPAFDLETVILVPHQIIMDSETELTQYFIKHWSLAYIDNGILFYVQFNLLNVFAYR